MSRKPSEALTTLASAPPVLSAIGTIRVNQKANKNGPDHRFQLNEYLLYEREFPGHTYISAHLQRLQNGIHTDDNMHAKNTLHVTFAAITFTLHPSLSISHRFTSLVVNITAQSANGDHIRFLKFAPHLVYGRISAESLKWNFQLGATLGVTKGPVNLSVQPTGSYEKDKVVGTMMKIQGSTRSTRNVEHHSTFPKRLPDTRLVWSLEENAQQETGLPREFTFVFLMERRAAEQKIVSDGNQPAKAPNTAKILMDQISDLRLSSKTKHALTYGNGSAPDIEMPLDHDYKAVFTPVHFSISVQPQISGIMTGIALTEETEESIVSGEVGQRFPTKGTDGSIMEDERLDAIVDGMYNFAQLPGSFEDLIELPGNAVTTMEPTLPEPCDIFKK